MALGLNLGLNLSGKGPPGPSYGPEVNTSPASWLTEPNWVNNADGSYTATAATGAFYKSGVMLAGKTYRIAFTVTGYSAGTFSVVAGGSNATHAPVSANGSYVFELATGAMDSWTYANGAAFTGTISALSIKEIL